MSDLRRYLLFFLLIGPGIIYASSWDQVAQTPDAGTTYFVDYSRITKTPKGFKLWAIVNDETPDPKLHTLSVSYFLEVNCDESKEQYSSLNGYAGHMAMGDILLSINEPSPWFDVKANTVVDDRLKAICQRAPEIIRSHGVMY
jgi:hypothetical protein